MGKFFGARPYNFGVVRVTPRGLYEYERTRSDAPARSSSSSTTTILEQSLRIRPPQPVGSPFGFTDQDWRPLTTADLRQTISSSCSGTSLNPSTTTPRISEGTSRRCSAGHWTSYNVSAGALEASLHFRALSAGYGEHLFNEIARDIISADIAVFDTSDLNPNVMLEFGVALTWGTRVLPIRREGRPLPPSDVSGQTWAVYRDSGAEYPDPQHRDNLGRMVERAIRKKTRAQVR